MRFADRVRLALPDPSTVVIVCADRAHDYVPAAWACIFEGRTFLPWQHRPHRAADEQSTSRLDFVLDRLDTPAVVTTRALAAGLGLDERSELGPVMLLDDPAATPSGHAESAPPPETRDGAADPSVLLMTSGTTGTPKLVELPYPNLLNRWHERRMELADQLHLAMYPYDTAFGQVAHLFVDPDGALFLDLERAHADPAGLLRLAARHRCACISGSNALFASMADALERGSVGARFPELRSVRFSGELISPDLATRLVEGLRRRGADRLQARLIYASSELGAVATRRVIDLAELRADADTATSMGPSTVGCRSRIVDEHGELLTRGRVGHLQCRSEGCMFAGYHRDEEATRAAFTDDGWFRTGDLAVIDHGGLTIVGRESGMIIASGRNVSLEQIDARLADVSGIDHGLVASAPVRAAAGPTEELAVFYVPTPDTDEAATMAAIRRRVADRFGIAARHVVAVDASDFARTRTGKVDREQLAARLAPDPEDSTAFLRPDTLPWLDALWADVLGIDAVAARSADFFELGGDSLGFARLVVAIEDRLGMDLPIQRFLEDPCLERLAELVGDHGTGTARSLPASNADTAPAMRTLERMAATWTGERVSETSLLVGANLSGTRTPIVWVCQSHHELHALADELGPDQPILGFRSLSDILLVDEITSEVLDAVAYRYLTEILAMQPPTPFVVGGNCAGAVIALALARKLRQFGLEPRPLVLLNWQFRFGRYDGPVVLLRGQSDDAPFALEDLAGRPIDWRRDFPGAEAHAIPGGPGHFFSGEPLVALAGHLHRRTSPGPRRIVDRVVGVRRLVGPVVRRVRGTWR